MTKRKLTNWNEIEYIHPEPHRELPTLKDVLIWLMVFAASLGIWALVIWGLGELVKLTGGVR